MLLPQIPLFYKNLQSYKELPRILNGLAQDDSDALVLM